MGKLKSNFIRDNGDGSMSSDFKLTAYETPEGTSLARWSAAGRSIFQREYTEIAEKLTDSRKVDASQAINIVLQHLNSAVTAVSQESSKDWRNVYCAVSMNHLVWLSCFDKDDNEVTRRCNELAALLKNKVSAAYDKVRCPAMTSWPVTERCYKMLASDDCQDVKLYDIQGLMTAYAAAMAERDGLTTRDINEHGIALVDRQDKARETMSSVLGIVYPRWLAIKGIFATGIGSKNGALIRTPVMPIVTGLARTLIMVTMPMEEAAIITTDILANAWPLNTKHLKKDIAAKYTAQLFAGMVCTACTTPEEAINKTCYVWTRYLW